MLKNINIFQKENISSFLLVAAVVVAAYTIPYVAYFAR